MDHGAATPAELRILRQGSATECDGSAHLLVRVHVLRGLRRGQAAQCLPELRRRIRAAPDPARAGMAARIISCEAAAIGPAGPPVLWPRRCRRAFGADQGYSAAGALSFRHRHSRMVKDQSSDAQLRIGESRDSGFRVGACHRAALCADPLDAPRNDTKKSRLVRVEPLFQSLPAIRVIVLQRRGCCRMPGDALRIAGLEHEGHGAGQLDRL
jgi:hypothetical protein